VRGHGGLARLLHFAVGVVADQMAAFAGFVFLVGADAVMFEEECVGRPARFDAIFDDVCVIILDLQDHFCNFIDLNVRKLSDPLGLVLIEINDVKHSNIVS
jgi:hypothetical protein